MTKNAFITLCGRPNVGKSSILNALVGEKVAIVTSKPQTTRTKITGILTRGDTQFVFADTPGMHRPQTKLSEQMVKRINESVAEVDAAVLTADASYPPGDTEKGLIAAFAARKMPAVLALNKSDLVKTKEDMLAVIAAYSELYNFEAIVPMSAKTGEGLEDLLDSVESFAAEGPHFFDGDSYTDQPERAIAAEIIREKILFNMHDEIPHGVGVIIEKMKDRPKSKIVDISALIYCEKSSHKGMIIGKGGTMMKKIASEARSDIERFLGTKVNLECWIKVKEDWRNKDFNLKELGLKD